MLDHYQLLNASPSFQDSLKELETDIHHANMIFYSREQQKGLSSNEVESNGKPNVSPCGRKATIKEFYSVILPSLQRLRGGLIDSEITEDKDKNKKMKNAEDKRKPFDVELERENECGICLEPCTKMVLPNCCHTMCVNCYHDWNTKSESCPFCRRSLKRVNSGDLWVLTCSSDVIDVQTVLREDLQRLHLYINSLPKDIPDALFLMYYDYLF